MSRRPVRLEIKLPRGQQPSEHNNESLINRFLKTCSKEGLMQYLYENSAYTKRFDKESVLERKREMQYRRNAQRANKENMSDAVVEKPKKKIKKVVKRS